MGFFQAGRLRGAEMRRLRRQLKLTRWGLWSEQVARAFWPVFVIVCLAAALALLGAFAALGATGHRVLLGLFALALVAALVAGGARFRRPDEPAVRARLDATDPRRPLATLADDLAVGRGSDPTESVWRTHRLRAAAAAARLTAGWPDLRLASRDRWALRLFAPALLIAAFIGTGGDWAGRIATIADPAPMSPSGGAAAPDRVAMAEAWAVPPAYTGLGTVYLTREEAQAEAPRAPVRLPQGSEITIRVTDAGDTPVLEGGAIAGLDAFRTLGGGLAEARGVLAASGEIAVSGPGGELARWPIEMIPDAPPAIALDGEPTVTLTRSIDLAFTAKDDYGVVSAWAEMAPEGHDPDAARGLPLPVITFGLPLPITGTTAEVSDHAIRDFTSHPWAGAEVMLRLYAEDGAGQVTATEPLRVTIPDRRFQHPLARALVEQRRDLALDYARAFRVLDVLQAVTRRPEDIFEDKTGVFLTVRSAIRRLAHGVGTETVPDVAPNVTELLWTAALALEDGDLSEALERLRTAQDRLREALENGSDEDIARAMEELRAALDQYLQQLAQQGRQNPDSAQQQPMDPNQMLSRQDLQEMLDRMQQQAESGMRDQARDMLSQLQQMLENLQAAQGQQQQGQQAMQQLQEMIQQQRDLSDRTFDELRQRRREQQLGQGQQSQQGQQGQQGQQQPGWGEGQGRGDEHGQFGQGQQGEQGRGEGSQQGRPGQGGLAGEQEALRRQLEELSRGLGNGGEAARRALEEAARAMGEARSDLEAGANSDAVRDQMEALDRLNEGADALAQEMQQGQGEAQAQGDRQGRGQGRDQSRNDPFDRPTSSYGALDGRSTKVPDQALVDRARELMRELRRRAAEASRPRIELDYFERLLDQF